MTNRRLHVPLKPVTFAALHPNRDFDSADWKAAARYGIQPSGRGIQVYAQPASLAQITSLRDALSAVIDAWQIK